MDFKDGGLPIGTILTFLSTSALCFTSSFMSIGLSVQAEKRKLDF